MSTCEAVAARCSCVKPPGHEGPHACGRDGCLGQWTYDADGEIEPVVYPSGSSDPVTAMMIALGFGSEDFEDDDE